MKPIKFPVQLVTGHYCPFATNQEELEQLITSVAGSRGKDSDVAWYIAEVREDLVIEFKEAIAMVPKKTMVGKIKGPNGKRK